MGCDDYACICAEVIMKDGASETELSAQHLGRALEIAEKEGAVNIHFIKCVDNIVHGNWH